MEKVCTEVEKMAPVKTLTNELRKNLHAVVAALTQAVGQEEIGAYMGEFKTLFKKLNSASKLTSLRDKMHRAVVVEIMSKQEIQFYNYSYFNRARLTERHLELLREVGPFLFIEGVMIVSKMNVIYKNYSRIFIEDHLYQESEDIIDSKIREVLKMCDEKKRSVNNNLKKLELLFQDPNIRIQLVRELGKLLRDSWKMEKSKNKCNDVIECNQLAECDDSMEDKPEEKEMVKQIGGSALEDQFAGSKCLDSECQAAEKEGRQGSEWSGKLSLQDWSMKNEEIGDMISFKSISQANNEPQDDFDLILNDKISNSHYLDIMF